jgi:AbrB family looped-hinge helix DNA binding protein
MRLQKRFLREINKKKYYKFMINIPPEIIEEAKLKEGDELEVEVKDEEVRLKKK